MTSARRVMFVVGIAAVMVVAAVAAGSAGIAVAQDDDDDVPGLPAVYHGELTITNGQLDEPVVVEVVADGEVQDRMLTDGDGTIGGPTISDDKLEVQPPDDGTVEFHVGGEPVTITELDGQSIEEEAIDFAGGTQEIAIEATTDQIAPDVAVTIDATNSPVEAGEELTVDVTASNVGPSNVTETVTLESFNGTTVDTDSLTLGIDETATTTLTWTTTEAAVGEGTLTITATGNTDTVAAEVEIDEITAPDPGGVGGQPSHGDDSDDTSPPPEGVVHTETQTIATSEEFDIAQVRFTDDAGVASITWDTSDIPTEDVGVETYNETPDAIDPVPGAMISVSEVLVPADASDTPAMIELRADRERLTTITADVADLQIVRYTDGNWEPLSTTVSEETDDTVTLEAETPGFSFFAIQATGEPTAEIDAPDTVTADDTVTLSGSGSTTPYGVLTDYEWTIDDTSVSGETISESFDETGSVTIELQVTNDAGETDSVTTELTVESPDGEESETASGESADTTDDNIPGFGAILTVIALLVLTVITRRQR